MLTTLLTTNTPQQLAATLKGQAPLQSEGGAGGLVGIILGVLIVVAAVTINYRRNHSFFYAFLAFLFSEFYLAFVLVSAVLKKVGM